MSQVTREVTWKQWAGSLAELAQAVERAQGILQQWAKDASQDPRDEVAGSFTQNGGYTTRFESADELRQAVDPRDLATIESFSADVGRRYAGVGEVQLRGDSSRALARGLRMEVHGPDRHRVDGMVEALTDALRPRQRLSAPGMNTVVRAVWIGTGLYITLLIVISLAVESLSDAGKVTRVAVAYGGGFAAVLVVALLAWAAPPLEVLEPAQQPRFQRWKSKLIGVAATILLGIASSIVATAIYSGG